MGTVVNHNENEWSVVWGGLDPNGCYSTWVIRAPGRRKLYGFRDIRDGTSNTIAMSERRIGNLEQWYDIANVAVNVIRRPGVDDTLDVRAWYDALLGYGGRVRWQALQRYRRDHSHGASSWRALV